MEGFRHHTPIRVRFADLDALGHLNHANYLTYMEQARILYIQEICGWDGNWVNLGMILAKATVDYLLPVQFGDEIGVYTRCSRLGTKSFDLEYVMTRQQGDQIEITAKALTVMVAFDYPSNQAIPVPDHWREAIRAYESMP